MLERVRDLGDSADTLPLPASCSWSYTYCNIPKYRLAEEGNELVTFVYKFLLTDVESPGETTKPGSAFLSKSVGLPRGRKELSNILLPLLMVAVSAAEFRAEPGEIDWSNIVWAIVLTLRKVSHTLQRYRTDSFQDMRRLMFLTNKEYDDRYVGKA